MKIDKAFVLYHNVDKSIQRMQECIASLFKYKVDFIRFLGYTPKNGKDGLQKHVPFQINEYVEGESEASVGHYKLWELIAMMDPRWAYCIVEDDSICKWNLNKVDVQDFEIVFLGPRLLNRSDYEYFDCRYVQIDIDKFHGAHAYCITPTTAKFLINRINQEGMNKAVDAYLGLENTFNLKLSMAHPPLVICDPRKTRSFNEEEPAREISYLAAQVLEGLNNQPVYESLIEEVVQVHT